MNSISLARHSLRPRKTKENVRNIPSLDNVQQVDIVERRFQRSSRRNAERLTVRTGTKKVIISRLEKLNHKDALRMKQCCSVFNATTCGQHTVNYYPTFRCKRLYCPDCACERAARLSSQTEAKITEAMKENNGRLCFLTLTIKNDKNLEEGLADLKKGFTRFKRKKVFREHIKGYFGGFENPYSTKGNDFNNHLHLIVLRGKFWSQSDIAEAWKEATGDSFIVDIREIDDLHKGVKELCKYIVKPLDLEKMPDDAFAQVVGMKRGTRMFISGGCFYNVKVDETDETNEDVMSEFRQLQAGDPCPFCKETLFDVLVDREAHIGLQNLNAMPNIVKNNSS